MSKIDQSLVKLNELWKCSLKAKRTHRSSCILFVRHNFEMMEKRDKSVGDDMERIRRRIFGGSDLMFVVGAYHELLSMNDSMFRNVRKQN